MSGRVANRPDDATKLYADKARRSFSAARQMVREKIGDQRPIPKRHVVADVIAAFEDDHLLRAGRLLEDALRLLERDEILCAVDDQQRAADLRREPFERAAAVQLGELFFVVDLPDVRDAREFERVVETVERARAVVHAARKRARLDAVVARGRARSQIAAHARPEDAEAPRVDLGNFFQIIAHRGRGALEVDDDAALEPTLALSRAVEGE